MAISLQIDSELKLRFNLQFITIVKQFPTDQPYFQL